MNRVRKQPKRSLRTILIVWLLLFSVVPLAFVTGYSLTKFEKAIDRELSQRLSGNAREISGILNDYKSGLQLKRDRYVKDATLNYHLTMGDGPSLRNLAQGWLKQDFASGMTFFNRDGRMLVSVFKDERGEIRAFQPSQDAVFLSEKFIADLKRQPDIGVTEFREGSKASLVLISKVNNAAGRTIGYFEQAVDLDKSFLLKLKSRMKLEVILFRDNGDLIIGSHPDFYLYRKDFFRPYFQKATDIFFEMNVRGVPFGFVVYPQQWDQSNFYVALGASKSDAKAVLKNINLAFITVVGAVVLLLLLTIFISSDWLLKPVYELVDALQSFETQEQAVTIPVKNDTEIGLLTESFNEMSKKISQARTDLRQKIKELEATNKELKETQTKLVHSAKMVSLGQLVAGVAHELNNPIGFIYSNMNHLRDYSQKLIDLVKLAEKNPKDLPQAKEDAEFDYIVSDMPKLIASCEDGARRTRDIVLGLRNFSRLEEAKLTEVDLRTCLDTTLSLLQGEIKNRIQVHRAYEPIPIIHCYVSQINQVFMNILSNALQAIEGQGEIWITTQTLKAGKGSEGQVQVSIQDTGKGMTNETLEKIFDPFFTTKGVGQGTGLGLSISYGIIQNHGGEILVKSEVGVGTEFVVILPLRPPKKLLIT